jgi:hypothetical protein
VSKAKRTKTDVPLKHTKGEWIVDAGGTDDIQNMADCLLTAKGTKDEWMAVGLADHDGYAESIAYCHANNAPMIAAAPDLHKALLNITRCAKTFGPHGTTMYFISDKFMADALRAVAKAENR